MNITTVTPSKSREGNDELFVAGNYLDLNSGITKHFAKWLDVDELAAYQADPGKLPAIMESYVATIFTPKTSVSMRQARLALLQAGLLSAVNAALAEMPGDTGEAARIEWEYATEIDREWPLVASLAGSIGLTDSQLDDLFALAREL